MLVPIHFRAVRKTSLAAFVLLVCRFGSTLPPASAELQVGTAAADIAPTKLPVLITGGFLGRTADKIRSPLCARAIVLDDGRERIAVVVADNCAMPRELIDEAKKLAAGRTRIRPDRMLIGSTHTHSAPSSAGGLGTDAEPEYAALLRDKLAEAIAAAEARLQPARVGWAVGDAGDYNATRRWIRRPDRIDQDAFGNPTVRANMHAAADWDNVTGPAGPEDPDLAIIAFQSPDGRPLAVLANFGMHYYSDEPISADYYGLFCAGMQSRLGKDGAAPLAMMSHGCSGDMWLCDYEKPPGQRNEKWTINSYTEQLLDIAMKAYATITYQDADLAMAETRLRLPYRVPDRQRLEWAQRIMAEMGNRPPANSSEVYAREQIHLHQRQAGDVVLQAIRIGNILIAATPTETYALTGLKIKRQSPLPQTMVLDLANGSDGYLPPPEQHGVGGYNTWAARSSCLEVRAEPKIAEASVELLEKVAGRSRRVFTPSRGPAAAAILAAQPAAYWRLDEWEAPRAADSSGHRRDGIYEPGVVFFLTGPRGAAFCAGGEANRAAHFCGGRLRGRIDSLTDRYTVSLWFWNGMPLKARPVTGWLFSRGRDDGRGPYDDHLGIDTAGKLIFQRGEGTGEEPPAIGRTAIERWTWNHAVLVRDGKNIRVYLNGNPQPEIETALSADFPAGLDQVFLGGRSDNDSNWEGRLDEIAVFDRALSAEETKRLFVR
jgi:hypothetical protein